MSNRKINNEIQNEINRYLNNKMSNKERYEFERLQERDPFLADALEGMSNFKASDINKDLSTINIFTGKKRKRINPIIYLSIAAGFLLIIVSVALLRQPRGTNTTLTAVHENNSITTQGDSFLFAAKQDTLKKIDSSNILIAEVKLPEEKSVTIKTRQIDKPKKKTVVVSESKTAKKETKTLKNKETIPQILNDTQTASHSTRMVGTSKNYEHNDSNVQTFAYLQKTVDAEEEIEATPKSMLPYLKQGVNAEAKPFGGKTLYDKYIEDNIQYPISAKKNKREVVRLKFVVNTKGIPENFTIIKAPDDKNFASEAIRLVKEGPNWSPEIKDGIPIAGETSLRIVFKP